MSMSKLSNSTKDTGNDVNKAKTSLTKAILIEHDIQEENVSDQIFSTFDKIEDEFDRKM